LSSVFAAINSLSLAALSAMDTAVSSEAVSPESRKGITLTRACSMSFAHSASRTCTIEVVASVPLSTATFARSN